MNNFDILLFYFLNKLIIQTSNSKKKYIYYCYYNNDKIRLKNTILFITVYNSRCIIFSGYLITICRIYQQQPKEKKICK